MHKKIISISLSIFLVLGAVVYFANSQPSKKFLPVVDAAQVCTSTAKQTATTPLPFRSGTKTLNIPKFDPSLGTLQSVDFDLESTKYDWLNEFENLLAGTNTLSADVTNQLKIERPDTSVIYTTPLDSQTNTFTLPDFDGVLDFGGLSGRTVNYTSPLYPNNSNLNSATDLALFTGPSGAPGTLGIVARALGTFVLGGSDGTVVSLINWHVTAGVVYNYCYTVSPASVGDKVFSDVNANGVQDAGEPGIAGATVTITDTLGNPVVDASSVAVGAITTPASGAYSFTNLTPGNYIVKFTLPAGYVLTSQDAGGNDTTDSDADSVSGKSAVITLTPGQNNVDVDAGGYQAVKVCTSTAKQSVSSVPDLFDSGLNNDQTGNLPKFDPALGTLQSVDFTIENVYSDWDIKIENLGNAKNNLIIGITNKLGVRRPDGTLLLGTATDVQTRNPPLLAYDGVKDFAGGSGYSELYLFPASPTTISQTTNLATASDLTLFSGPSGAPGTIGILFDPDTISTASGVANVLLQDPVNWHATASVVYNYCNIIIPAKLGDLVFNDSNANGIQDAGETGISGATVSLTDTLGNPVLDAGGVAVANITTSATGAYQFTNLIPGNYIVNFTLPAGYTISPIDAGGNDTTDSDADIVTGKTAIITLIGGQNNVDVDAGGFQSAKLGDFVWVDSNANGVQDAGETGLAGAVVSLTDSSGNPVNDLSGTAVASITTPASGAYQFTNLLAGTYKVKVVLPATYKFSPLDAGGNDTKDSDAIISTGITAGITLVAGDNIVDTDFGAYIPASIGDFAWNDVNANGVQDVGELGLSGVIVKLTDSSGNPVIDASGVAVTDITTPASGVYTFTNLIPGNYIVKFTSPSGYVITSKDAGGNDVKDSDADITTGSTPTITLTSGQNNLDVDAGFFVPAKLGNFVWVDTNANGVQDSGEAGLAGAVVSITDNSGNPVVDASGVAVANITTPASGAYQFTNLTPGNYKVKVVLPATYKFSPLDAGGNDVKDSDTVTTTGITSSVTLAAGQTYSDLDSGAYIPASLGDFVWNDINANGVQDAGETGIAGVVVTLLDSLGNPVNDSSGVVVSNITTTATGIYTFTNLVPSNYIVKFVLPGTYVFTNQDLGGNDAKDSDANTVTGKTTSVTLSSGQTNLDLDAGALLPAKLGDFVWEDTNANGIQDAGEPGISGAVVSLSDNSGNPVSDASLNTVASITTTATGLYQFTNLLPGNYKVKVVLPTGFTFTLKDTGLDTKDSDVDVVTGITASVTLIPGQVNVDVDAGAYKKVSLGDFVWNDKNQDGIQDATEVGIDDITVELRDSGNVVVQTQVTSGGGKYLFTGVIPGVYTVKFTKQVGMTASPKNVGPITTDNDADTVTGITANITLVSGVDNLTIDSGYFGSSVEGDVWVDLNKDNSHPVLPSCGTTDPLTTECGVPAVTLDLKDSTNTTIQTVVTDTLGHYKFVNLPAGTYSIIETQPLAYKTESVNTLSVTITGVDLKGKDFSELPAQISGYVYEDSNDDGLKGVTEPGIVNATAKITGTDVDGNSVSTSVVTNTSGYYEITNLRAGTYILDELQPINFADGKDTAGSTGGMVTNDKLANIVLGAGDNSTDNNFGEKVQFLAKLSGIVWVDTNGDGVLDNTEVDRITGVLIKIYNSDGNLIGTTITDSNGYYQMIVNPGNYLVIETQPANYGSTTPNALLVPVVIDTPNNNFGENQKNSISGFVYIDKNDNGLRENNEPGIPGTTVTLTYGVSVKTNTAGAYAIGNLVPGTYEVVETQPDYIDGKDTAGTIGGTVTNDKISMIVLGAMIESNENNFGELSGTISGTVYIDMNKNQVKEASESTLSGVEVKLKDVNGLVLSTKSTDVNGAYKFDNLSLGVYSVEETQPAKYNSTTPDILSAMITNATKNVTGVNYGEVPSGKILGVVWNDANKNGVKEPLETYGIPKAVLEVRDSADKLVASVTTGNTGNYEVGNLEYGAYKVTVKHATGWTATTTEVLGVSVSAVDGVANYGAVMKLADTGADNYLLLGIGGVMVLVGFGIKRKYLV